MFEAADRARELVGSSSSTMSVEGEKCSALERVRR